MINGIMEWSESVFRVLMVYLTSSLNQLGQPPIVFLYHVLYEDGFSIHILQIDVMSSKTEVHCHLIVAQITGVKQWNDALRRWSINISITVDEKFNPPNALKLNSNEKWR